MGRTGLAVAAAVQLAAAVHGALLSPWIRGDYGRLSFSGDCMNYSLTFGDTVFTANADALSNATDCSSTTGSDDHGEYDQIELSFGQDGELTVKYYTKLDAFVFGRQPRSLDLPTAWPNFSVDGFPTGPQNLTLRCIGWGEFYFFPGQVLPRTAHTKPEPFTLHQCNSGGPLFVFGVGKSAGNSIVLSPLDNFTTQGVDKLSVSVGKGGCKPERCNLFSTSAILLARPGLVRTTRAFGAIMRQWHGTTRLRGSGVSQLSYWNDNQAGYSWWTVGPDQEVWGKPEDIYLKLKQGYDAAGVPIRGWEPDNNWLVTYGDGNEWGNGSGTAKNWQGRQWDYNTELYPSGGEAFVSKMGNLSMTYYTNGFNSQTPYKDRYHLVKNNEPHPNISRLMYGELLSAAKTKYNMEMLFTDFLCYRQPAMEQYQDVAVGEEGGHLWLGGQALAAEDNGIEVQWCMAVAHQILESLQFSAVTNARVNGDGGLNVAGLVVPALLAATVGLGWSKDNLRTADRCYVDGLFPNGTVKWPCGSINKGEGTSGTFKQQTQQTILATFSLGPVGISDQLSSYPSNASAAITSNVPLVLATCAATGDLLQPSYPLTPLERSLNEEVSSSTQLWGTYTAVSHSDLESVNATGLWFIAFAFGLGKGTHNEVTVYEADLAPMIDAAALPSPSFSDIPMGAFRGSGTTFPTGPTGWLSWKGDFSVQRTRGCSAVTITPWTGKVNLTLTMADGDAILNIAPVFGDYALLGEVGKITAVSTYRFETVSTNDQKINAKLRGKPAEQVALFFAARSTTDANSFSCAIMNVTIGKDGTAAVTFPN